MASVTQAVIRVATPGDIEAMMRLELGSDTAAHWPRARYQAIFHREAPPRLGLVAESSGCVRAFLVAQTAGPDWELENIVVASPARRQGLATLLLRGLLERARQQQAVAVLLEVRASNAAARRLYQACEFVEVGSRPRYYQHPQEDAVICAFRLG
jgi:[ribosomal protein S18]-alanine N-acetyltransferase